MDITSISSFTPPMIIGLMFMSACLSSTSKGWRFAEFLSVTSFLLALCTWIAIVFFESTPSLTSWLVVTPLRATILLLVSFIAYIVLRYARTNFQADADNARFLPWLTLTIFAVTLTVLSNHMVVFWFAWVLISLSMHKLLVFYPSRYRAVLAAHKKFISARVAELCLATAFLLLYQVHQSFFIGEILQQYPVANMAWQQQLAAVLFAVVALVKCAQLPLHGWLIQVVESPTPVSALLHAGVINLGGFLLVLFAPLFSLVAAAQWLVLVVAGFTAAFAALVMMTRISIKVRLAWSTTAQMGLMLVECGLGLYELALLHLAAHSCYKAHAFLSAGSTVSDAIQNQFVGKFKPSLGAWLVSAVISLLIVATLYATLAAKPPFTPWVLIAIALSVSLAFRVSQPVSFSFLKGFADAIILAVLYVLLKFGAAYLLPPVGHVYLWQADVFISALFVGVLAIYLFLEYQPTNATSRKLFVALNAGFYLDEWSTRLALRVWPIQLPKNGVNNLMTSQTKR